MRPLELAVLARQLLESHPLVGGQAVALPTITLRLAHPVAQGFAGTADLAGDRRDGGSLGRVLGPVLPHHPNRPFSSLC